MSKIARFAGLALVLVLVAAGLFGAAQTAALHESHAQNLGFATQTASGATSISAGTPAVLISASTTGQTIIVTKIRIATVTAGGTVTFYNGTANPLTTGLTFKGGNNLSMFAPVSTAVNNNVELSLPQQGAGIIQTATNTAFCAQLNGASLVYYAEFYYQ